MTEWRLLSNIAVDGNNMARTTWVVLLFCVVLFKLTWWAFFCALAWHETHHRCVADVA